MNLLTWPKVILAVFTLMCVTAAATWNIRDDRIEVLAEKVVVAETKVSHYENLERLHIPNLIKKMEHITNKLDNKINLSKLEADHEKLQKEYKKLNGLYEELKSQYVLKNEFTVKEGSSSNCLNGKAILGLSSVNSYYVSATLNNESHSSWDVGQYEEINIGGKIFRLILVSIDKNQKSAVFRLEALEEKKG